MRGGSGVGVHLTNIYRACFVLGRAYCCCYLVVGLSGLTCIAGCWIKHLNWLPAERSEGEKENRALISSMLGLYASSNRLIRLMLTPK